jgi:hypothetical protein
MFFLLISCKKNNNTYTLIPPCKYRVEYSDNKINIIKTDDTGNVSSILWSKKNGEYFDQANHLKMSLKDTIYYLSQKKNNVLHRRQFVEISKENDSIYSSTTFRIGDKIADLSLIVYYDKFYRIKRIRSEPLCEFVNK